VTAQRLFPLLFEPPQLLKLTEVTGHTPALKILKVLPCMRCILRTPVLVCFNSGSGPFENFTMLEEDRSFAVVYFELRAKAN
jgi:hypothetical protein